MIYSVAVTQYTRVQFHSTLQVMQNQQGRQDNFPIFIETNIQLGKR